MEGLFPNCEFDEPTSIDFFPCLLDDEVPSIPMTLDAGCSSVLKNTAQDKFFGSPSRESDSGLSMMSTESVGSPSTVSSDDDPDASKLFEELNAVDFEEYQPDAELVDYLGTPWNESEKIISLSENENSETDFNADLSLCDVAVSKDEKLSQKPLVVIPTLDKSLVSMKKQASGNENYKKTEISEDASVKHVKPAVKVVKVVRAPINAPPEVTDNEVLKAIEDRNRKNAEQAKINRQKKKAFISQLEDEVASLKGENRALRENNKIIEDEKEILLDEIQYLKNIIANQSSLSSLLKNIPQTNNIKLSTSFESRKRKAIHDHDYLASSKRLRQSNQENAGVCLHVNKDNVSLEFCSKCSGMANGDEV